MKSRQGDWFQTYTGKRFYILDPRPEDIDVRDIAHSLALKCRYGGHVAYFYSVAEHSVLLSHLVPTPLAFMALMHDAAEAYTGDIMRPIKNSISDEWRAIESRLDLLISEVFGLDDNKAQWDAIKEYDSRILTDEREMLQQPVLPGKNYGDKIGVTINCLPWQEAERVFMARFDELVLRRHEQDESVIDAAQVLNRSRPTLDVDKLRVDLSDPIPPLTPTEERRVRDLAAKLSPEKSSG